jgi:hypothetical protein
LRLCLFCFFTLFAWAMGGGMIWVYARPSQVENTDFSYSLDFHYCANARLFMSCFLVDCLFISSWDSGVLLKIMQLFFGTFPILFFQI